MGAAGRPAPRLAAHRSDAAPARHRVGWQQDWEDAWVPTDDDLSLDHDLSGDDFDRVFRQRYNQPIEMRPYGRGQNGKGLIGSDGKLHVWSTDELGFPHHDQISQQYKIPYDAKVDVLPSGKAWVQDWETRMPVDQAYAHIQQQGKRHGIYPASGGAGYFSSLLEEAAARNETTCFTPEYWDWYQRAYRLNEKEINFLRNMFPFTPNPFKLCPGVRGSEFVNAREWQSVPATFRGLSTATDLTLIT
jgi:hypothetical protein